MKPQSTRIELLYPSLIVPYLMRRVSSARKAVHCIMRRVSSVAKQQERLYLV